MNLRWVIEDGKKTLQLKTLGKWEDVPEYPVLGKGDRVVEDAAVLTQSAKSSVGSNPTPSAREYWLIAGRYFESKVDACMWQMSAPALTQEIIHVREVKEC